MISSIFGKVYTTQGVVFNSRQRTEEYIKDLKSTYINLAADQTDFAINDDQMLLLRYQGKEFPLSLNALKNLCQILQIPAQYINKSASEELTLQIIKENAIKYGGSWNFIVWQDSLAKISFISGVRVLEHFPANDFLTLVDQSNIIKRNQLVIEQHTVNVDVCSVFALSNETKHYGKDFLFDYRIGIGLRHSESSDWGFLMQPYYEVYAQNRLGEKLTFDFLSNEKLVRIPGKSSVYSQELSKTLGEFDLGTLSEDFEMILHMLNGVLSSDSIRYGLLKKARSGVRRVFNAKGGSVDLKDAEAEIIPEYSEFRSERREELKEMKPYLANNLTTPFFFPLFFHRLYNFPATVESADSFIFSKELVFKTMADLAETTNIGNIS